MLAASSVVVTNVIQKFIPYRGWTSPFDPRLLTSDKIELDMKVNEFFRVNASDGKNEIAILILSLNSKYAKLRTDFEELLLRVTTTESESKLKISEVIVIAEDNYFLKIKTTYRAGIITLNAYHYRNFTLAIPEHKSVPKHRIMSEVEVSELVRTTGVQRTGLPIIFTNDPPIIWLGGIPGQIIEITRFSQTSGNSIYYRRIERAM